MAAETGMNDRQKLKHLRRLNALVGSAQDLIHREARTPGEVSTLLTALQAFKEGRLGAVFFGGNEELTHEQLLVALSLEVDAIPLHPTHKKYLGKRGIRYLGELYYVVFDPRSRASREIGEGIFSDLQAALRVPKELDPLAIGWVPPYWQDPTFRTELHRPVIECFGDYARDDRSRLRPPQFRTLARILHRAGTHYMAQYLNDGRQPTNAQGNPSTSWGSGKLQERRKELGRTTSTLWAAALVPGNWAPLQEVPPIWADDEEPRLLEEQATWELAKDMQRRSQDAWKAYHEEQARRRDCWLAGDPQVDDMTDELHEKLSRPLESLECSWNHAVVLWDAGIRTIGQLVQLTDGQLKLLDVDFGIVSSELRKLGLFLYMLFEDPSREFELPERFREQEDVVHNENLSRSISALEIAVRTYNALRDMGIHEIGQLVQLSSTKLIQKGIGRRRLRDIESALDEIGLTLGMTLPAELREHFKLPAGF